jgi:hypothetical protein
MHRSVDNDELLLTAFRYLAGDLPAAKARQFEGGLDGDPAAQQALADAVLLGDALARSTVVVRVPPQLRPVHQRGRHTGAVLAVVAAAFLLAVSLWPSSAPDRDDGLATSGDSQRDSGSVLDVWNDLADSDAMGQALQADALNEGVDDAEPPGDAEDIPEWLLHAVAGTLATEEESAPAPEPDDAPATDEIDEST